MSSRKEEYKAAVASAPKVEERNAVLRARQEDCKTEEEFSLWYFHNEHASFAAWMRLRGMKMWDLPKPYWVDTRASFIRNKVSFKDLED